MLANNPRSDALSPIIAWPTNQHEAIRLQVAAHRAAGKTNQGAGGAIVSCVNKYDHEEYARLLGIPLEIAYLIGTIHQMLPAEMAVDWPERVVNALQPGIETTHVWSRFAIWLLREACGSSEGEAVARLYERRVAGEEPRVREWQAAKRAARAAEEQVAAVAAARNTKWRQAEASERAEASAWAEKRVSPQRQADRLIEIFTTGM